jgi:UDP-N-acetylenolpyruvoylglucosamine reductase
MAVADLIAGVQVLPNLIVLTEEPLARHTPLRVGGPVELWVEASDTEGLHDFLRLARETGGKWRVHWPFADWLVRDGGLRGTVLRLGEAFERIELHADAVTLGSAALWSALPAELEGGIWDALRAWPGSVGGLFAHGNAQELSRLCTQIQISRGGRVVTLPWTEDGPPKLGESTVLLSVTLRRVAAARRWLKGPKPTGTLFEEVADTAVSKELDKAGVLGTRLRRWRLSPVEPGTVVQLGGGTFSDLQMLIKGIRTRVEKSRGITIETRIPVLGNEPGRRDR